MWGKGTCHSLFDVLLTFFSYYKTEQTSSHLYKQTVIKCEKFQEASEHYFKCYKTSVHKNSKKHFQFKEKAKDQRAVLLWCIKAAAWD